MTIFCTKCGTKNEGDAGFCEGCGASLRRPASTSPQPPPMNGPLPTHTKAALGAGAAARPSMNSKTLIYAGAAVATLVLLGGVAAYLTLKPPAATSSSLLAAAKEGYGKTLSVQLKRELCLSNLNYSLSTFNAGENDQNTQGWLNTLVAAGLYSPGVPVSSGGYFAQTLVQYVATPELAKWRDGARLCVAKDVEIAEVVDIEKPKEETLGRSGKDGDSKLLMVKAKLLLQSSDTAPWLEKAEVRAAVLEKIEGWEFKNSRLQKQTPEVFALREGQWATGPAFKAELQKQYRTNQRASDGEQHASPTGFLSGLTARFSSLFSFGGHPLMGKWRMDTEAMGKSIGMGLPPGIGLDATMTFTSNAMEVGGQSIKCAFEVNGQRVKVTPEGQATSLIFELRDRNTAAIDMGLFKVQYKRVD